MAVAAEAFMVQRARAVEASLPQRANGKDAASPLKLRTFIVGERGNTRTIRGTPYEVFGEVFAAYSYGIFGYALSRTGNLQDAQDLTQETFFRAFRSLVEHPDDQRTIYVGAWLGRIMTNIWIDERRRPSRFFESLPMDPSFEEGIESKSRYEKPQAVAEMREEQKFVREVLEQLPIKYRTLLTLREFQGLSCQGIAEVTGSTESAVKSCLFRAREEFRKVARKLDPSYSAA